MKNVLMVAYLFPPAGGTGTVRVTKFSKYLPTFGWKPIILTSYDTGISPDLSTLEDLREEVCINRVSGLALRQYARQYKRSIEAVSIDRQRVSHPTSDRLKSGLHRWLKSFVKNCIMIPDYAVPWTPNAVLRGLSLIRRYNVQAIYSTGGPWSPHLVGCALKKLTGRPLILDFRDYWALGPPGGWPSEWRAMVERYLEKRVVESADKVISVCPGIINDFAKRYSELERDLVLITNGFDEMDFEQYHSSQSSKYNNEKKNLSIVYTGTLKSSASPKHFFLAIKHLIETSVVGEDQIQVQFAGKIHKDSYGKYPFEYIEDYGLETIVRFNGFIPRKEVAQLQTEADILLLFIDQIPIEGGPLSGKIFEYTAARRPVLALVPPNSAGIVSYLRATGVGIWVAMDDVSGIASKVKLLYETRGSLLKRNEQEIAKYSRKFLTGKLAKVFDTCIR